MKARMSLRSAKDLAQRIVETLRPGCKRIEIAGSIRRQQPTVGDIEIVAIPRYPINLLGEDFTVPSLLDQILDNLVENGRLTRIKNGPRYKQLLLPNPPRPAVDLYITDEARWGVILTIRTGPASFAKRLVTPQWKGGLLPPGFRVHDGLIWRNGTNPVPFPTERDIFDLIGGWIEPAERI